MGELTIGRVGLEADLAHPQNISISTGNDGRRVVSIRGQIKDTSTLAIANELRHELGRQVRSIYGPGFVAVTSTTDPTIDGYYTLESANVDAQARLASLQSTGLFPYSIQLAEVETRVFESGLTGGILANDFSLTTTETQPYVAPPVGHTSFTPAGASYTRITREGADGDIAVWSEVHETDVPIWTCNPADFYKGSCKIRTIESGQYRLRAGIFTPEITGAINEWQIDNSLLRITSYTSGSIGVECYDPEANDWVPTTGPLTFKIRHGANDVTSWSHLVILRNDPEAVAIRLIQNRNDSNGRGRYVLDIGLRRGSRLAHCLFSTDISVSDIRAMRTSTDLAVATTYGIRDDANDADGNRWFLGTLIDLSSAPGIRELSVGAIGEQSTNQFAFTVGFEVGGSSAQSGDAADDIQMQHAHYLAERVTPAMVTGAVL